MIGLDVDIFKLLKWLSPSVRWLEPNFYVVVLLVGVGIAYCLNGTPPVTALTNILELPPYSSYGLYGIFPMALFFAWLREKT